MGSFKEIPGHPSYLISPTGEVWSLKTNRLLTPSPTAKGYLVVSPDGVKKYVHALVLETFVGPRPPGYECRHLDGMKTNNAVTNLAWGTQEDNRGDHIRLGVTVGMPKRFGPEVRARVRAMRQQGFTFQAIAAATGVSLGTAFYITRGEVHGQL